MANPDRHSNQLTQPNTMAGDWIKVEENMPDKPEVCGMGPFLQNCSQSSFDGLKNRSTVAPHEE